jgi:hypothetical protein
MKITMLFEKAAHLTGGNRGNGDGKRDLCSLRFLLFNSTLLLASVCRTLAATHYVDVNSTNATPPYSNWATAATNIQDAVDAAVAGDEVVVTNGTYATGGRNLNVVEVDKPVVVRSINGPQLTTIYAETGNRCVYLTNSAALSGFTLRNGYVIGGPDGGAGVECESESAVVSNCVITDNHAFGVHNFIYGGGAYRGTLNNCVLSNNSVSALYPTNFIGSNESYGGGAASCTLNNCTLIHNLCTATNSHYYYSVGFVAYGGGAAWCTLNSCALSLNSVLAGGPSLQDAYGLGGGVAFCTLNNSTVVRNLVLLFGAGGYGSKFAGAYNSGLFNSIVYFNLNAADYDPDSCWVCFSCATPRPTNGFGNITNAPLFVDLVGGNLHLQPNSPCINAGNNSYVTNATDLDGNPRIVGGTVDIGAYEYQSLSLINFSIVSNQAAFSITGQSNQIVTVETSSDLMNWSPLVTNTLNGHPFPFSDPAPATLPRHFYRAQTQ